MDSLFNDWIESKLSQTTLALSKVTVKIVPILIMQNCNEIVLLVTSLIPLPTVGKILARPWNNMFALALCCL